MVFNTLGFPVTNCMIGFDRNNMPMGLQVCLIVYKKNIFKNNLSANI